MADHSSAPSGRQPSDGKPSPTLGDLFWIGTACAIAVVAGGGIGYALDSAFGTLPWLTFVGLAFGVISAVLLAVKQLRRFL
jgi:uncharacterized membrane protein YgaE (UPF0421/DUF939 family)